MPWSPLPLAIASSLMPGYALALIWSDGRPLLFGFGAQSGIVRVLAVASAHPGLLSVAQSMAVRMGKDADAYSDLVWRVLDGPLVIVQQGASHLRAHPVGGGRGARARRP